MVIANMNLKIAMLISVLFALAWTSAGLDPLYLGTGPQSQVIDLDAGARTPGQSYNFAATGFVAPKMPQTMALSQNIMITQAKRLMDEAQVARDESVSARDKVRILMLASLSTRVACSSEPGLFSRKTDICSTFIVTPLCVDQKWRLSINFAPVFCRVLGWTSLTRAAIPR